MKIAVTSAGKTLDDPVDSRFGRAPGFILFDTETGELQAVDNTQNLNAAQGAGIQAAEAVSRLGAGCLLTGHCGPKAFRTLEAAGIRVYTGVQGTVRAALEAWQAGKLTPTPAADVESHWA
jgi:predicted Fe-Mo cluster-binding NifX family protein